MAHNKDVTCTKCGAENAVIVFPMGVPGGKDYEQAYCKICGTQVDEQRTDGYLQTVLKQTTKNTQILNELGKSYDDFM